MYDCLVLTCSIIVVCSDIQDDEDNEDDEEEEDEEYDDDEDEHADPDNINQTNDQINNNSNSSNNNNHNNNNHNKRSSTVLRVRKVPFLFPKPLRVLLGHKLAITDVSWSKSNFLLSASEDKHVMVRFAVFSFHTIPTSHFPLLRLPLLLSPSTSPSLTLFPSHKTASSLKS